MTVERNSKSLRSIGGVAAIVVAVVAFSSACGGGDDSAAGPGSGSDASTSDVVVTSDAGGGDAAPQTDASAPTCVVDAATKTCGIDATHATIQSAIDDTACDRLCVPAREFSEALTIRRAFEIVGSGTDATILSPGGGTVDAGGIGGVLTIVGGPVVLRDLSVTNGTAAQGGCIDSSAPLTLDAVTVTGCVGLAQGGGIYQNGGSLTLENGSDVTGNAVTATPQVAGFYGGGGVYATGGAIVSVHESTIEKNLVSVNVTNGAQSAGGGILANGAAVTLDGATIHQNTAELTSSGGSARVLGGGIMCGASSSLAAFGGTIFDSNKADASEPNANTNSAYGGGVAAEQCSVTLAGVTFNGNVASSSPTPPLSGSVENPAGGAIFVAQGSLTADLVAFTGNTAASEGSTAIAEGAAALLVDGSSTFTDCTFDSNVSKAKGVVPGGSALAYGAVVTQGSSSAATSTTIRRSTISNNTATADSSDASTARTALAAGVDNVSLGVTTLTILVSSTVSGNASTALGASGSAVVKGAGICNDALNAVSTVELFSSTVTANTATGLTASGGGLYAEGFSAVPAQMSTGSILAGNTASTGADCATTTGTLTSAGYDWIGVTTGCTLAGPQTGNHNGDPKLSPLADNGGATKTHALAAGSGAINAGKPGGATSDTAGVLTTDQRALPRPTGASGTSLPDIGAFEVQ